MKRAVAIGVVCGIVLAGAYAASPLLGFYRIQAAARSADQDALESTIDFPAVRENLKEQLNTAFALKMQNSAELENNPFAGLGMLFATALVGKLVDSYLTPQTISAMVLKAKAPIPAGDKVVVANADSAPKIEMRYGYVNLDRFRVRATNPEQPDKPLAFLMERRSLFFWKLIRIELPPSLLEQDG